MSLSVNTCRTYDRRRTRNTGNRGPRGSGQVFYEWVASEVGSVVARMCSQEVQPKQNRKKDRNRGMDRRSHFSIYIFAQNRDCLLANGIWVNCDIS